MKQSVAAMKSSGNHKGLETIVEVMPKTRALVEAV